MTFDQLVRNLRERVKDHPAITPAPVWPQVDEAELAGLFTQEDRRQFVRLTAKCAECGKVVEQGGTMERWTMCRECGNRLDV